MRFRRFRSESRTVPGNSDDRDLQLYRREPGRHAVQVRRHPGIRRHRDWLGLGS